jgi:hypothetical protein
MYGLVGQPMACTATLQTRLPVNLEAVSVFPKEHKELVNVLCSLTASLEEMLSHHASTAQAGHDVAGGWRAESVATGDDYCRLEIKFVNSYEQGKAATARFADEQLFLLDGEGGIVIGMVCHMDRSFVFQFNQQSIQVKSVLSNVWRICLWICLRFVQSQQSLLIPHIFSGDGFGLQYCSVQRTSQHQVMLQEACIAILTVLLVNRPGWVHMHRSIKRDNVLKIHKAALVLQQLVFDEEHIVIGRMQPTETDSRHDTYSTQAVDETLVELCMCHMAVDVLYSTKTLPEIVCKAIGSLLPPQGFKPFLAKYPDKFQIRTHLTDDAAIVMFKCIDGRRKPHDLGAAALGTVGQNSVKQQLLPDEHTQQQSQTTKMSSRDEAAKAFIVYLGNQVSRLRQVQEHHNQALALFCGTTLEMDDQRTSYHKTITGRDDGQAPHLLGCKSRRGKKRVAMTLERICEEENNHQTPVQADRTQLKDTP